MRPHRSCDTVIIGPISDDGDDSAIPFVRLPHLDNSVGRKKDTYLERKVYQANEFLIDYRLMVTTLPPYFMTCCVLP